VDLRVRDLREKLEVELRDLKVEKVKKDLKDHLVNHALLDPLDLQALLGQLSCRFHRTRQTAAPGDDAQVAPGAAHAPATPGA
jgi:hypothetical protein